MTTGTRILDRDGHVLNVADQGGGKLLLLITGIGSQVTDGYTIGLAPASLAHLREQAARDEFDWTLCDGTFRIVHRGAPWVLTFTMTAPPYQTCELRLTDAETKALGAALLGRGGR